MAFLARQSLYSPLEYLALERSAPSKSEFLNGQIYAIAGGSPEHAIIAVNIGRELSSQLKGWPCQVFSSDLKIATSPGGLYAYPDLSVVCGDSRFHDDHRDLLTNPVLIVEVLSPATEGYDRGKKFYYYRQIESLKDYLLVSQEESYIDLYHKDDRGQWALTSARGCDESLYLPSIECSLKLSEVYDKIAFPSRDSEPSK